MVAQGIAVFQDREPGPVLDRLKIGKGPVLRRVEAVALNRTRRFGGDFGDVWVIEIGDQQAVGGQQRDKFPKRPFDRLEIGEDIGVIELERGDNRHLGPVVEEF